MKNNWIIWLAFLPLLVLSCHKKTDETHVAAPVFCLNDTMLKEIRVYDAVVRPVQQELRLNGKVTFDENKVVKVYPLAGGLVIDLKVELGDFVEKEDVLAVIRSNDIVDIRNEFNTARYNLEIAKKNLETTEDLFKGGLNAEKDVITARSQLQIAESDLEKSSEKMRIYGTTSTGDKFAYTVKSPITGFIVQKNITENTQFRSDGDDDLFTVADLSDVWIMADVYESDIEKVKIGYSADIQILSYSHEKLSGVVDKIFNVLDAETRVQKIRIKLKNKGLKLKPEMYASVTLRYETADSLVTIPEKAIVFDNGKNNVVLYKDKCNLETREVGVVNTVNGFCYLKFGLKPGDKVMSGNTNLIFHAIK